MRLLIVEDEPKTAAYLRKGLQESGFAVEVASDGEEGLALARQGGFALIVCDVMMPRLDGWGFVKALRAGGNDTPRVIFLTARDAVADRVHGLDLGADDYLVKPFAFSELLARVRSLLRRSEGRSSEVLRIAGVELDPVRHKASRGGKPLNLTAKEFALLELLMRRCGAVLSRTVIAEQVWDMNFDANTNFVDVAIRRLRQKVDDSFEPKLIHTVRGLGYVFRS